MSGWVLGFSTAATLAGSAMQANAAGDAAETSAGQAAANAEALRLAGVRGDQLLATSGGQADQLLREGYQGAVKDMKPYDRLGIQGSNALANYMGFATQYTGKKPETPKSVDQRMKEWGATLTSPAHDVNYFRNVAGENDSTARRLAAAAKPTGRKPSAAEQKAAKAKFKKQFKAETTKYNNALAQYQTEANAFAQQQQGAEGFGEYFKPYDVPEPTYKPYKEYEQFTDSHLKADPLFQTELDENVNAWDRSAAARGSLMSGNTVAGLRDITAAGIGRARGRHIEDYEQNRGNYLEDYGITHDEWLGGYDRDWNQDDRKYNALAGLADMGLQVRTGLANARINTASQRAGNRTSVASNRSNTLLAGAGSQATSSQYGADSRAAGQIGQGNAYGNAFNNIAYMGMRYGQGAFGGGGNSGRGNIGNPAVDEFYRSGGRPWGSL